MLKFGESKNLAGEGPASNANLPIASGATPLAERQQTAREPAAADSGVSRVSFPSGDELR